MDHSKEKKKVKVNDRRRRENADERRQWEGKDRRVNAERKRNM